MNIEVQCCGVAILALIWYFSLRQKSLGLVSEKLFHVTMGVNTFCLVMDILSIIAINNQDVISGFLLALICKTYIVSLVWVGYFGLIYSHSDFRESRSARYKRNRLYTLILLIGTALIYTLPIYYYLEGKVVYTYGPSCMATYAFALLFVMVTLFRVIVKGKDMIPRRRRAIIMWMATWIVAAVTQFLNANLLLVGFASVLGMVILFFELENPEANLDRETGAYNAHALGEYSKQSFERQEWFCAILLALEHTSDRSADAGDDTTAAQIDRILQGIVRYAEQLKEVKVFKTLERELVFLVPDEQRMQEVYKELRSHIETSWVEKRETGQLRVSPSYMMLTHPEMFQGVEDVFQLLRHYRVVRKTHPEEDCIVLNEDRIKEYKEMERTELMIRSAIEEDRIEVFYQPIYSTRQHRFLSAEALARIRNQDGSIVAPGSFIPVAEKNGLISRIGESVFDKTCAFIQKHRLRERYGIEYVEVNLSVRQCEDPELARTYIGIIEKYQLDPSCINLEITESASIRLREILLENMRQLMDYGVKFALDDFGNGESNLNYIVDMPVSIVKFDRDMSQAYFANQKAKFVMEAAMHMIHHMELEVVSEGVETREQADAIEALGIEYIQGYYFSKPLPEEEFLERVAGKMHWHRAVETCV
ncbi:MAG: EAL domain-containing protein [Lachnospiraceae bacterium]|nr:EAL domain-containing protein [Lachnospiraceae bacterium]